MKTTLGQAAETVTSKDVCHPMSCAMTMSTTAHAGASPNIQWAVSRDIHEPVYSDVDWAMEEPVERSVHLAMRVPQS